MRQNQRSIRLAEPQALGELADKLSAAELEVEKARRLFALPLEEMCGI